MFNLSTKMQYIESIEKENTRKIVFSILNRIGDAIEKPINKEIATMSADELTNGFTNLNYVSYTTLRTDISFLKAYIKWYHNNIEEVNIEQIDHISARNIDLTPSIQRNLIKNETVLKSILKDMPPEEGYYEIPIFCFLWMGITLDKILQIKNEDVYLIEDNMFVRVGNKSIYVQSNFIKEVLINYSKAKMSVRLHRGEWVVYADDLGYYIKNMYPANFKLTGQKPVLEVIQRKLANFDPNNITPTNVLLSGKLNRVMINEKLTGSFDIEELAKEFGVKKIADIKDVIPLYICYKKAFWAE